MFRITLLKVVVLAGAWGNAGLLLAGPTVVVGAGVAVDRQTGDQLEFAVAAAVKCDGSGNEIAGGLLTIRLGPTAGGASAATAVGEVVSVQVIPRTHDTPDYAVVEATVGLKYSNGARIPDARARFLLASDSSYSLELDAGRNGVAKTNYVGVCGYFGIEAVEVLELLSVAIGAGTNQSEVVETDFEAVFQAAAAIGPRGTAIGYLSLLANVDDGAVVRISGVADQVALEGSPTGQRLNLHLAGGADVDVFPADNTPPETCSGDFMFSAAEGPLGLFRIALPDCREALAGIEGSDSGAGGMKAAAMAWPERIIIIEPILCPSDCNR